MNIKIQMIPLLSPILSLNTVLYSLRYHHFALEMIQLSGSARNIGAIF